MKYHYTNTNNPIDFPEIERLKVVFILEVYYPEADESRILNVFSTMENAIEYRNRYIREEYGIEDDFDGDLLRESPAEFFINKYQVL